MAAVQETEPRTSPSDPTRSGSCAALGVFVALVVIALPVLVHLGRQRWFVRDEWDFITARHLTDVASLFKPRTSTG